MKQTIYKMKLHEKIEVHGNMEVTRVPGGWIYRKPGGPMILVPFDNEFMGRHGE